MARFRLRFLLQEIDVHPGTTLIGRSPECQVTIEDPLVSRQHARVIIDQEGAWIEDLDSRNGVKVNGQPARGIVRLRDGDRLRIGTQEVVLCEIAEGAGAPMTRTTGFLRHCANCRLPYPQELISCPNCGGTVQVAEDTTMNAQTSRSWSLQLLLEVLEKALTLGRQPDAVSAMRRLQAQVEERFTTGEGFDTSQLNDVARAALQTAAASKDGELAVWALRALRRAKAEPVPSVVEEIGAVAVVLQESVQPALEELVAWLLINRRKGAALPQLQEVLGALKTAAQDPDQTKSNPAIS